MVKRVKHTNNGKKRKKKVRIKKQDLVRIIEEELKIYNEVTYNTESDADIQIAPLAGLNPDDPAHHASEEDKQLKMHNAQVVERVQQILLEIDSINKRMAELRTEVNQMALQQDQLSGHDTDFSHTQEGMSALIHNLKKSIEFMIRLNF